MTSLAELQRRFQRHVLAAETAVVAAVAASSPMHARARLAIYRDAYRLRLTEALASNFPRLQQWLGTAEFGAIAQSYIAGHPSSFRSIRWFGAALPAELERSHAAQPWLADLACWEWALAAAFDAADAQPLDERALGAIAPDDWPELRFDFHPSLQCLALRTNAPAIFKALAEETPAPAPAPSAFPDAQSWVIWRQNLTSRYRCLDAIERAALEAAVEGATFADTCAALCTQCDPQDVPLKAASLLKRWAADGLLTGARI